jgi:hypothetical protein
MGKLGFVGKEFGILWADGEVRFIRGRLPKPLHMSSTVSSSLRERRTGNTSITSGRLKLELRYSSDSLDQSLSFFLLGT